jgi:hypothetical protein
MITLRSGFLTGLREIVARGESVYGRVGPFNWLQAKFDRLSGLSTREQSGLAQQTADDFGYRAVKPHSCPQREPRGPDELRRERFRSRRRRLIIFVCSPGLAIAATAGSASFTSASTI